MRISKVTGSIIALSFIFGCNVQPNGPPLADGVPETAAQEYNAPTSFEIVQDVYSGQPYNWMTSNEQARVGLTSHRFELRHGDCGPDDCNRDRQRIEVLDDDWENRVKVGEQRWYGWSIFLDKNFRDLGVGTPTILGQVKLPRWRSELWNFTVLNNRFVFKHAPLGAYDPTDCATINISQMRNRWTDVVVFADYSLQNTGKPKLKAWVNGKLWCQSTLPIVTREMLAVSESDHVYMKYGIYTAYVSEWLGRNKTKKVNVVGYTDIDVDGGGSNDSITDKPFDVDWGVKLPTLIAYYDEVRIGNTRRAVDIRLK